jgi:hypothetical protein
MSQAATKPLRVGEMPAIVQGDTTSVVFIG